jgi:polysaccharide export outer membrane protein
MRVVELPRQSLLKLIIVIGAFWLLTCQLSMAADNAAGDYRVGPGDLLRISVFGYPDLANDIRVSESGNLTFPLIGAVPVWNLSPREIETTLSQRLTAGHFIRESQVTVLVIEYQSQLVAVLGEVAKPGQDPLKGSRRVLNLLADAGGVNSATAGDTAVLVRANGSSQKLDLTAMLNGSAQDNPVLAAGDTINVPKAPQFYIYGEVQKPGAYRVEHKMTVLQAISDGGGLTHRGTERGVIAKRRDARGNEIKVHVKSTDLVQPDDVLLVKESWF